GAARAGESAAEQVADRRPGGPAEPSDTPEEADRTQSGLPKRTPRAPRPGGRAEPRTGPGKAKPSQDAGSTHSFLSNYQSGIRRARPDER
ncbi:hypothetical protein, partial [Streptomyces botrytidirepellens]